MRTSFLLLSLILSANCFAGMYKWVDANGKTHYSDQVPEGSKATELRTGSKREFSSSGFKQTSLAEREKELKEKQTQNQIQQERKEMSDKDKAEKERNCKTAQQNKQALASGVRIRTVDEKGEQSFMTPTETKMKLEQVEKDIQQLCN